MIVRGQVRHGRLVVDQPTDLPEGSEVTLEQVDDVLGAEFDAEERAQLEASLDRARAEAVRGGGVDGMTYLAELRSGLR